MERQAHVKGVSRKRGLLPFLGVSLARKQGRLSEFRSGTFWTTNPPSQRRSAVRNRCSRSKCARSMDSHIDELILTAETVADLVERDLSKHVEKQLGVPPTFQRLRLSTVVPRNFNMVNLLEARATTLLVPGIAESVKPRSHPNSLNDSCIVATCSIRVRTGRSRSFFESWKLYSSMPKFEFQPTPAAVLPFDAAGCCGSAGDTGPFYR